MKQLLKRLFLSLVITMFVFSAIVFIWQTRDYLEMARTNPTIQREIADRIWWCFKQGLAMGPSGVFPHIPVFWISELILKKWKKEPKQKLKWQLIATPFFSVVLTITVMILTMPLWFNIPI